MEIEKEALKQRIEEVRENYWIDKTEFGKVLIIASLSLLVVSMHAIYTIDSAVEQASNSTDNMKTTAALVGSDGFQRSMESLAGTGATIGGQSIEEVVGNLQYASDSVQEIETLSDELDNARTTYQWTFLLGLLGLVTGITSIYI